MVKKSRKYIPKKKKNKKKEFIKKWFPIVVTIVMVSPGILYGVLNKSGKEVGVTLRFEIYGQTSEESLRVQENTTLISILSRYPIYIENNTLYCLGQLCEDEGNWTFIAGTEKVNPFKYNVKHNEIITLIYE